MWKEAAETQTLLIHVWEHHTGSLKLCGSAVVYHRFLLQQTIKTLGYTQKVPCVAVFLCLTFFVECQHVGGTKNRKTVTLKFVLSITRLCFSKLNKTCFINSNLFSTQRGFDKNTESFPSNLVWVRVSAFQTYNVDPLVTFMDKGTDYTKDLSCRPIIRGSDLLQILVKRWELIRLEVKWDSIHLDVESLWLQQLWTSFFTKII